MFEVLYGSRKRALFTVIGWIIMIGVFAALAPTIDDVLTKGNNNAGADAASTQAAQLIEMNFPDADAVPAILTVRGGDANVSKVLAAVDSVRENVDRFGPSISAACKRPSPTCVPASTTEMTSGDTNLVVIPVTGDPTTTEYRDDIKTLRAELAHAFGVEDLTPDAASVHVTGPVGIVTDTVNVFAGGDKILLLATMLLVLVILLAVYRAPLMALLPLFAVGMAMRLAQTGGALLADAGIINISSQTASIMTVLLFGVGTDYALIINARWREHLRDTNDPARAMIVAMGHVLPVLLSSAGTIVAAMLALLTTTSPTLQGFGPYLAIGVVSAMIAALTLLPALMVLAGRVALWPNKPELGHDSKIWTKVADLVTTKPKAILAGTAALMVVLALGLLNYSVSYNLMSGFRIATDSAAGQKVIAQDFGEGEIAPSTMIVTGPGADAAAKAIAEQLPQQLPGDVTRAAFSPRKDVTEDGSAARVDVVLNADPYSTTAFDMLDRATEQAGEIAGSEVRVASAGETATARDSAAEVTHDFTLLVPLIFLVIALILGLLLRSWLAPIYLIATLGLSFAATLGLVAFITLTVQGDTGFGSYVPVYVLVFLTALGVDYTIFVMARLREEMRDKTMAEAMRRAIIATGGVVSSAGLILAATFAVLMTQPIRELYQFGMAMMLGILIDTFIIRPLMVPAIVTLLGDRALLPAKPRQESCEASIEPVPAS